MAHLALALMGSFLATLDGRPIQGLNSAHLRALLSYLAVERGREHPREQVASLLWPNRPDREALSALRNALSNLRAALGDRPIASPILLVTRTTVQLNPAGDCGLDVAEFERLMQDAGHSRQDSEACLRLLESCVALYRGPFLHGLSLADSPTFQEWVLCKGELYRRSVLSALEQLTSLEIARGQTVEAARTARQQLDVDPYREQANRQLMAALALVGERAAALAHYQAYRQLLADELACEPDDETQALYAQIRDARLSRPWPQPQAVAAFQPTARQAPIARAQPAPPLVAREQELARLCSLLDRALAGRGGVALIAGYADGETVLFGEFVRQASYRHGNLIVLLGRRNAPGGTEEPFLPLRDMLEALAANMEGNCPGQRCRRSRRGVSEWCCRRRMRRSRSTGRTRSRPEHPARRRSAAPGRLLRRPGPHTPIASVRCAPIRRSHLRAVNRW